MAGDEFKAGRVRKLLKNLMPSSDAELVEKARAERKERAGGWSSYQYEPPGRDDSIPTLEQIPGAVGSRVPDSTEDDGLLMQAPSKKTKRPKKKAKRTPTGSDAPVDVNGEY